MNSAVDRPRRPVALKLLFGLLVLGFLLVLRAPAAFFAPQLERLCQQRCVLGDVDGTLWQGRGSLFARDSNGGTQALLTLGWRFVPSELSRAKLVWLLNTAGDETPTPAPTPLIIDAQGWQLKQIVAQLPVSAIEPLLEGRLGARGWNGLAQVQVDHWSCSWSGAACVGRASLRWTDARVSSLATSVLGDYRLDVGRTDASANWTPSLKAERGPLWVELTGTLSSTQFTIRGPAWIDAPARRQFAPLLGAFAPYDAARERYNLNIALPIR
jgi:hypothetical protein